MTTYISRAFEKAFNKVYDNESSFLNDFKDRGCYLDDLYLTPVNKCSALERKAILPNSIDDLSRRIRSYNSQVIVIILKRIDQYVREAIDLSDITFPVVYTTPFPGNGHQNGFIEEFFSILKKHLKS